jgi:ribosomal protein S18 acetylase RimI-like enzyme
MNLRPATVADAPALARLHLESLPAGLSDLSPLGERLVRHFYARAIERGVADVRVAEEGGELLGFVAVTADIGTMFPRALLAGPVDVLTFLLKANPIGLVRVFATKVASGTTTVASFPEIVYMGVSKSARGRGLGRVLMHQGQLALEAAGIHEYQLNVHAENEHGLRVHIERGFEVVGQFEKGGQRHYHMVCKKSPPPPL